MQSGPSTHNLHDIFQGFQGNVQWPPPTIRDGYWQITAIILPWNYFKYWAWNRCSVALKCSIISNKTMKNYHCIKKCPTESRNYKFCTTPFCTMLEGLSHQMEDILPLKQKGWLHTTRYQPQHHHTPGHLKPIASFKKIQMGEDNKHEIT